LWPVPLIDLEQVFEDYFLRRCIIWGTIADPRVIFVAALKANCCAIIISHNHPSGNLKPSRQDEELTQKIKQAGQLLDIKLLDHVIITNEAYFSFADEGLF
jgi:DNA repair protein RadC